MSLGRRLYDLARANLNALLEKAAGSDTPVGELSDEELKAELERRRLRREREADERRDREAAERAARQRAAERAQGKNAAPQNNSAGAGKNAASQNKGKNAASQKKSAQQQQQARRPPPAPAGSERRLRDLYAQLEVPYGAPFDEVKSSFRRLMRKYHPDLHAGDPVKHRTATQLTMSLTQAYNELETHLQGGRRAP